MTDYNRGRSPAGSNYNSNVDNLHKKVQDNVRGQYNGRRSSLVEGRRLTENRDSIRRGSSTADGTQFDGSRYAASPARARVDLSNFENYANRDIDEAQHIANNKRGKRNVDVSNLGLSYDHVAQKLGNNQNRYAYNYQDEGQIVTQKRSNLNVGRTGDGGLLGNFEGKFMNKFFQRYRIPTEESEEIPEPPKPEPFPMTMCWTLIIFWICFLIWTIIMSNKIDDLSTQFTDLNSLKVFKDMRGELAALAQKIKTDEQRTDLRIKALEKHVKKHLPLLGHYLSKYELIEEKLKKLQKEVEQDHKEITELKKFQIVVKNFMQKFIKFVESKGTDSDKAIKKTIKKGGDHKITVKTETKKTSSG